jgi:hypothetical protein
VRIVSPSSASRGWSANSSASAAGLHGEGDSHAGLGLPVGVEHLHRRVDRNGREHVGTLIVALLNADAAGARRLAHVDVAGGDAGEAFRGEDQLPRTGAAADRQTGEAHPAIVVRLTGTRSVEIAVASGNRDRDGDALFPQLIAIIRSKLHDRVARERPAFDGGLGGLGIDREARASFRHRRRREDFTHAVVHLQRCYRALHAGFVPEPALHGRAAARVGLALGRRDAASAIGRPAHPHAGHPDALGVAHLHDERARQHFTDPGGLVVTPDRDQRTRSPAAGEDQAVFRTAGSDCDEQGASRCQCSMSETHMPAPGRRNAGLVMMGPAPRRPGHGSWLTGLAALQSL